jgi:VTC domain
VASHFDDRIRSVTDSVETRAHASEIKFLVDPGLAAGIRAWARDRFAPDPHGSGQFGDEYRTTSLYFDTSALDVFHRRGSFGRSKHRIRRYGQDDVAFLERKLRTSRRLVKRRTAVSIDSLEWLDWTGDSEPRADWEGRWFARRLAARRLRAVCQVSYRRTARVVTTSLGEARLTCDDQVRARAVRDLAFGDGPGLPVLEGHTILEMKFRGGMPAAFRELVERFCLPRRAVSKYRLSAVALDLAWDDASVKELTGA